MSMNKKSKKWIVGGIAILAAFVGIAVAVGAYLKKHSAFLNETLDYDDELFYEDDEDELEYDAVADKPQELSDEELPDDQEDELPL